MGNGEAVTFVLDTVVCLLVNTGGDVVVLDLSDTGFVVGLNVDDVVVFDTVLGTTGDAGCSVVLCMVDDVVDDVIGDVTRCVVTGVVVWDVVTGITLVLAVGFSEERCDVDIIWLKLVVGFSVTVVDMLSVVIPFVVPEVTNSLLIK